MIIWKLTTWIKTKTINKHGTLHAFSKHAIQYNLIYKSKNVSISKAKQNETPIVEPNDINVWFLEIFKNVIKNPFLCCELLEYSNVFEIPVNEWISPISLNRCQILIKINWFVLLNLHSAKANDGMYIITGRYRKLFIVNTTIFIFLANGLKRTSKYCKIKIRQSHSQ